MTMVPRPDVNATYGGGIGDYHGFDSTMTVAGTGAQNLAVYTFDAVTGSPVLLHQGTVTVASPDPFGDMNTLTSSAPLKVHLTGWAADPSAPTQSLKVRIFRGPVGTTLLGEHTANVRRTDVGRAYPGYGELHGWDVTLDVPSGQQQICVQALNVGVGTNVALECGMVTVAPDTTPPITSITSASPGTVPLGTVVAYGFSANEPATFECSWDGAPMSPCASPSTADLPVGAHDFHVRATDASGNVETTPVGRGFEILPPGVVKISAALKAVKKRSRLRVDLGPDSSALNYRFVVQRKVNGKWRKVKKARTKGPRDRRVLDLKRGVYRVKVPSQFGLGGTRTRRVRLAR
ncbi:MAG: hypothetical protein V9G04_12705 [Nocardioides sp.]